MLDIFTACLKSLEQKKRARENRIKNLIISGTSSSSVAGSSIQPQRLDGCYKKKSWTVSIYTYMWCGSSCCWDYKNTWQTFFFRWIFFCHINFICFEKHYNVLFSFSIHHIHTLFNLHQKGSRLHRRRRRRKMMILFMHHLEFWQL